jgi:succinoglycan biosynthesis transport protein ExoP
MELRRYADIVRRRWWLLLLGPVVAGVVAYFGSEAQTDIYQAETTVLVNQIQWPGTFQLNDILTSERLTNTYAELVKQRRVLSRVIDELDLPYSENELKSKIDVDPIPDTQLLKVKVKDPDPVLAASIANMLAQEFIENNETELERPGTVNVVGPAVVPTSRTAPPVLLNTVLGVMLGILIASGIVLLLEYLDDTVKSSEDVANLGLSPLAVVTETKGGPSSSISMTRNGREAFALEVSKLGHSSEAEEYRVLRTNIHFATMNHPAKVLLVTSANPLEGRSTIAANLAVVMAKGGRLAVLVDADLRRPSLDRHFGISNDEGLTTLLLDEGRDLQGFPRQTGAENLALIPSGPLPPNPTDLLASSRMVHLLERIKKVADIVILDGPPLHAFADASILAGQADATLLVIEAGKTRTQTVRSSLDALQQAKVKAIGAVINKVPQRDGQFLR